MLKSDFNGYEEFMKKIGEATKEAGSGELLKLVFERQTMWLNKIADAIFQHQTEICRLLSMRLR